MNAICLKCYPGYTIEEIKKISWRFPYFNYPGPPIEEGTKEYELKWSYNDNNAGICYIWKDNKWWTHSSKDYKLSCSHCHKEDNYWKNYGGIRMRNNLFDQIAQQASDGHNIMCCFPRRAGKTHLASILINCALVNKKIVHLAINKAYTEALKMQSKNNIESITFYGLNSLYNRSDIDCIIVEEPYKVKPENFNKAMSIINSLRCQVIFLFSPFVYNSTDPHPLKILWDTAPWFKYQISAGLLDNYDISIKELYNAVEFQTEIEGNWVAV